MRACLKAIVVSFTLILCTLTTGLEGQEAENISNRKGFIIGFGLGPGYASTRSFDEVGVASDFKIGSAVGKRWQVYFSSTGVNYKIGEIGRTALQGIGGIGVTHNLNETKTTPFLMGSFGLGFYGVEDANGRLEPENIAVGIGITLGGGIHLRELWTLSLALGTGSVKFDGTNDFSGQPYDGERFGFWHVRATFNVLSR